MDEFYNPALKPKSTICYDERGARISHVKIITPGGKKINVLHQENSYLIVLRCNIRETLKDVRIGVAIKDHKGVYYSGAAFELLKHANIEEIGIGNYKISMNFKCLLVEGFFVIDTVVLKNFNRSKETAHRINDAYLFKVLKVEKNNIIESYVPMIKNFEINEIN
jgi:lipopolysaccharide transport system ATP-binding protein